MTMNPMKTIRQRLKSRKGLTLVEVVVSLAILSLLAILLTSVFTSAVTIVGKQAVQKQANKEAAGGIENVAAGYDANADVTVQQSSGNFSVQFGGVTIEQQGAYYEGTATDQEGSYTYFEPNGQ